MFANLQSGYPAAAGARLPNGMATRMTYGAPPEYPGRPGMVTMRPTMAMAQYPQARPQQNGAMVMTRQQTMPPYMNGAAPMPGYGPQQMVCDPPIFFHLSAVGVSSLTA